MAIAKKAQSGDQRPRLSCMAPATRAKKVPQTSKQKLSAYLDRSTLSFSVLLQEMTHTWIDESAYSVCITAAKLCQKHHMHLGA